MIEIDHLTKRFGDHLAVDDVSFRCEPGTVTGFLGPNGAGKSTTMRAIVGLTHPTSGHATIDGKPYKAMGNPGRRVGVLLDASAQHPGRTGRETLALTARLLGVAPGRVDELLQLVQLSGKAEKKRVGDYSLGMRQRLGIAHALLGDPGVLILDEPANGLDPEGIHWMRGLLRGFADQGGTVLLSSHLLSEVEAVADRFVILARGRVEVQGTKAELLGGGTTTLVRATDLDLLQQGLGEAGYTVTRAADALNVSATAEQVGQVALDRRVVLTELRASGADLEQLFLTLTAGSGEASAAPTFTKSDRKTVTA
ncbi:MAG: ATP-binding cassette domain-containing protein [Solirubrobacteraceae bacterium]|nr:ATP-binding cassette domain-containing protein [Solirubrobacteraceae bacterium]